MADFFRTASAVMSDCGLYRYRLDRRWSDGPTMAFIMLNPSTADAEHDDPTIRRCLGFARREGCGALVVVNLYSLRATKPRDLWSKGNATRIGGPRSEIEFHRAIVGASTVVAAWGADPRGADHWIRHKYGQSLKCLGKTKDGHPRHPLYVRADAPLIPLLENVNG